jgi:isoleucyl-tRNA synthetase
MSAARANDVEFLAGGGVRLAGIDLSAEEVEILATPRPGTAVAHEGGLVVVIDTQLTDELRAEGHAREVQRALQDLRKDARLELEDRVEAWLDGPPELIHLIRPFLPSVAEETNAVTISTGLPPDGVPTAEWSVDGMSGTIGLRAQARAA